MSLPALNVLKARALLDQGRPDQAEALLRRHLQRTPSDTAAEHFLSAALLRQDKTDQALYFAQRAAAARPNDAAMFDMLGTIFAKLERHAESRDAFTKAVELAPDLASARNGLGLSLQLLGDLPGAIEHERRAVALDPANPGFAINLALSLNDAWRPREAMDVLKACAARRPDSPDLWVQIAALSNSFETMPVAEVTQAHRKAGTLMSRTVRPLPPPPRPDLAGRPLRVGFLSADMRDHSVARFLEPLLAARPREGLEVFCYSASEKTDAFTDRLRAASDHWRDVSPLSHDDTARLIRKDAVDVLVDLGVYTVHSRVEVIPRRPAPVQVNYLGYPNTSGVPAMDFRVVDSTTDPPGSDAAATERLVRLDPCFLCFRPPGDAPDVGPLPAGSGKSVAFACFNTLLKVSPATVDLWSRVLHAVPNSRLLLKAAMLKHACVRERVHAAFAARGIDAARVELILYTPTVRENQALYHRADIALDPIPYHGTTTTCEALWMGVPVVTLAGDRHASRVGVSLLSAVGPRELVAETPDQFVAIAAGLAADLPRLASLRAGLRERVRASQLCDAPAFSARFFDLMRSLARAPAPTPA